MIDPNKSLFSEAFWLRTFFVIGFYVVYRLLDVVVLLVAVTQWLIQLVTGEPSQHLRVFGISLSLYAAQIIRYLSGASDERPFPFSDWPDSRA